MKNPAQKNKITEEIVRYVARLSRLRLDAGEIARYRGQLSRILEYIAQLDEVNTDDTLPTSHVLPSMKNVFREDEVETSLSQEEALSGAPAEKDGFFQVPRVLKDA